MNSRKVIVRQDEEKPIATEVIAQSIVDIGQAVKQIRSGRLNNKALLILTSHASGISMRQVDTVLAALENLEKLYVRKGQ